MKLASVVLYKGQLALIAAMQDGKLLLESSDASVNGKKVREKDVFVLSEAPAKNLAEVLNAEIPPADFSVAHEFFPETASFTEIAELFYGELKPAQMWKAWQAISLSPYFVATVPSAPMTVRSPAEVEEAQKKEQAKADETLLYEEFLHEAKKIINLSGTNSPTNEAHSAFDTKKYLKFLQGIEQVAYGKTEKLKTLVDLKVKQSPEAAHELLLKLGFWPLEKNPYPQRFEVASNDAKEKIEKPEHTKPFTDLTQLVSYAIDNADSNDPDDAVCLHDGVLYIHVACPAETVASESPADDCACDRGSTLYLPEQIARMLNRNAVEYYALGLERECFALTFAIRFTADYEIADVQIMRSKITVERLTYEEAETKKDGELQPLFALSRRLYERRIKNGAVVITMPEVDVRVTKNDTAYEIHFETMKTLEAPAMIREMMLIAGEAGAFFAFKNQIPFQYISQEEPTLPEKLAPGLAGEYQKRKCMRSRSVSTQPSKHFALGLSMYAQLTSPLRRYVDLISQQQILKFIDGERLIDRDELLKRLARSEIGKRNINQVARLSRTHWILVYLARNMEKPFDAVVLDMQGNKAHVIVSELAYEADIHVKSPLALNDTVKVKAAKVNIPFQQVNFTAID